MKTHTGENRFFKKCVSAALTVVLLLSAVWAVYARAEPASENTLSDELITVAMAREYSSPQEPYGPEYFGSEYVLRVETSDYIDDRDDRDPLFDRNLILLLYLTELGKAHVEEFTAELNARSDIIVAERDALSFNPLGEPTVYMLAETGVWSEDASGQTAPALYFIFRFGSVVDYEKCEITLEYDPTALDLGLPVSQEPWGANFESVSVSEPGVLKYTISSGSRDDLISMTGGTMKIGAKVLSDADPCLSLSGTVRYKNRFASELRPVIIEKNSGKIFRTDVYTEFGRGSAAGAWSAVISASDCYGASGRRFSAASLKRLSTIYGETVDPGAYTAEAADGDLRLELSPEYVASLKDGTYWFEATVDDLVLRLVLRLFTDTVELKHGELTYLFGEYPDAYRVFFDGGKYADRVWASLVEKLSLDGEEIDEKYYTVNKPAMAGITELSLSKDYADGLPKGVHDLRLDLGSVSGIVLRLVKIDRMAGDLDGRDGVTARDARIALRASASLETLSGVQFENADIDRSGNVTAADARKILRASANLAPLEA